MLQTRLRVGDSGEGVERLHEQLARQGFAIPAQEANRRFFGPGTLEMVRAWQAATGQETSGVVAEPEPAPPPRIRRPEPVSEARPAPTSRPVTAPDGVRESPPKAPADKPPQPDAPVDLTKQELLELDTRAHLTVRELLDTTPHLAEAFRERLDARVTGAAAAVTAGRSDKLREVAESITLRLGDGADSLRDATASALRASVLARSGLVSDDDLRGEIEALGAEEDAAVAPSTSDGGIDLAAAAALDQPVAVHPDFARELATARLYRLSDAAGLDDRTATVLADELTDVAEIEDQRLGALVKDQKLSEDAAHAAGRAASLYFLLDERPELVGAVGDVDDLAQLARKDQTAWTALIESSGVTPPAGLSAPQYAELLTHKIEQTFPAEAFAARLERTRSNLSPGVDTRIADLYHGMEIAEVASATDRSADERSAEITRRVGLVDEFLAANPDALALDLTHGSPDTEAVRFAPETPADDQNRVLRTVRAFQRAYSLTDDVADATILLEAGFPSAVAISASSVTELAAATRLPAKKLDRYRELADGITAHVGSFAGSTIELAGDALADTKVGNVSPAIHDYLREIPGFADFFGSQASCNCRHCDSILSPAAYFVDLMTFVESHVTTPRFAGKPAHPLRLETRRPDLWTLDLTCANTNSSIPYLVVITEVLERAVAADAGYGGDPLDRQALAEYAYREALPKRVTSFSQPFHLPFEELRAYLKHFDRTLADVAESGGATGGSLTRLRLAIAPGEYSLIANTNDDMATLQRIYGIAFSETAGAIQPFDAHRLLKPMGVTRDELGDLITTRFVNALGPQPIVIASEKRDAQSIQNDVERVTHLSRGALDRLHRFVRLQRKTGWTTGELDLVLTHVEQAGLAGGLTTATVDAVARVHRLRDALGVTIENLVGLWSALPLEPVGASAAPLLDREFNPAGTPTSERYPAPSTQFLHPALAGAPGAAANPNLQRLKRGTGTDEDELYQLIVGLRVPLGIQPQSANDADKRFALSHRNLTLLHRHSRLARALDVRIPELFALAALADAVPLGYVEDLDGLEAVLALHRWWKSTTFTIADLVAIVRPGTPAIVTTPAPVTGTTAGQTVTIAEASHGQAQTVTFAANTSLNAIVGDWNAKSSTVRAYRSDRYGIPAAAGAHLSLRSVAHGPDARLTVNADSAGLFAASLPRTVAGASPSLLGGAAETSGTALAAELVASVERSGALTFADTIFALLPPVAPVATSTSAVTTVADGESVTVSAAPHGRALPAETITLGASATLDAVIADWNAKSETTRAYRSDAGGNSSPDGDRLSIMTAEGAGAGTVLAITADTARLFATTLPVTRAGADITDEHSRALVAANPSVFEAAAGEGRYRLAAHFDPAATLTVPAMVPPQIAAAARAALLRHHSEQVLLAELPAVVGSAADVTAQLAKMLGRDLAATEFFKELRRDSAPVHIAGLLNDLRRLGRMFGQLAVFDGQRLAFVAREAAGFGIDRFDQLTMQAVRNVEAYRALHATWLDSRERPPDIDGVIADFDPTTGIAPADVSELARALRCDTALLTSVAPVTATAANVFDRIERLKRAVELTQHLGAGGAVLMLTQSNGFDDLAVASATIQAAFRSKHPDEDAWARASEPFRDALLARRRDGLAAYLLHSATTPFDEASDLYHYFLLDVELDGCARTSRVAAAIDSVQLYVERCRMNFEQSPPGTPDPVHVIPQDIPAGEWDWRRNYRVWEAARKVYLEPESFLEPELRDDKTPLFRQFEDELLSKEITEETILEGYARYLRGFDELSHLAIAGAYHEKDEGRQHDALHLLGVKTGDAPAYYYRRVDNAHFGIGNPARPMSWGSWEPLDIQIPVPYVSPVVYHGQLHVFWVRYVTTSLNTVIDGSSTFTGYRHRAHVEFTRRRLDGSWTPPERIRLTQLPFDVQGDGVVLDPIVPKSSTSYAPVPWLPGLKLLLYRDFQPLYDDRVHEVPKDDYTLRGFMWDRVFPGSGSTEIWLRGANFQMASPLDLYRMEIGPRAIYSDAKQSMPTDRVPWVDPALLLIIWLFSGGQFDLTSLLPPRLVWSRLVDKTRILHSTPSGVPCFDTYAYATLLLDEARISHYERPLHAQTTQPQWTPRVTQYLRSILKEHPIADVPAGTSLDVVNGSVGDVVLQTSADAFYLQYGVRKDGRYHLRRLSTTVSADIANVLFNHGLERLLATTTQMGLREHATELTLRPTEVADASGTGTLDFRGPMGVYLREIFFHIPFLIADYFNSQGMYEQAQRWYHTIFDPTADSAGTGYVERVAGAYDASGRLHFVDTAFGAIGHAARRNDGFWDRARRDVKALTSDPGTIAAAACTVDPAGTLHVCAITAGGGISHTLRTNAGAWQPFMGDVKAATSDPGYAVAVGCAADSDGRVHVCVTTTTAEVWHTIRHADGSWNPGFSKLTMSAPGPGRPEGVACAADANRDLHVCVTTSDGAIWHTIRHANGTWVPAFGDVKAVTSDPGTAVSVACAADGGKDLHVCVTTYDGGLWHTIRHPDGSWQRVFGDVRTAAGNPGQFGAVACAGAGTAVTVLGVVSGSAWLASRRGDGSWEPFRPSGVGEQDRSWRYREFRGLDVPALREILSDAGAISAYRRDPFNPHAIARLRLTAYQKAIVMKYIDNLLDWGDELFGLAFSRMNPEYLREATQKYVAARELLGDRPALLGDCGQGAMRPKTFRGLQKALMGSSDFLTEIESYVLAGTAGAPLKAKVTGYVPVTSTRASAALSRAVTSAARNETATVAAALAENPPEWAHLALHERPSGAVLTTTDAVAAGTRTPATVTAPTIIGSIMHWDVSWAMPSIFALVRQVSPAFCVPRSERLLQYWDRVEDRLYKLRHCLDIEGVARQLPLFAAAIDPGLLVGARAAGLTLQDALAQAGSEIPPYRFQYLIERAKNLAGTVERFGAEVLTALEKRDAEELTRLRNAHERNLLALTTDVRKNELKAAEEGVEIARRRRAAAELRRDHYAQLVAAGLTPEEVVEEIARGGAGVLRTGAAIFDTVAAIAHLVPEVGSPFAMKYGGQQIALSASAWSMVARAAADVGDTTATIAGIVASHNRREQEWKFQQTAGERDVATAERELVAAELHRAIAQRQLELHDRSRDHHDDVMELYETKFSNLGLYTHLGRSLQRLHREAYASALSVARLAERAYRFERPGDDTEFVGGEWETARSGLLAGERLTLALQRLESRFIETNDRELEIEQSVSVAQLDPEALVTLKETGVCTFSVPEVAFDLPYPGQYRRRIRAVRVTVPCVVGPYTNVGATLTLLGSRIRRDPTPGPGALAEVPLSRTRSVATSRGQADAGVFELSFRDERYMPFEGAGAVSDWRLQLPAHVRPFDYQTLTDVVLTINYTALQDGALREHIESATATIAGNVLNHLKSHDLTRVFSLRHEFPVVLDHLMSAPLGQPVTLELSPRHFPLFLQGRTLKSSSARMVLVTRTQVAMTGVAFNLNGAVIDTFSDAKATPDPTAPFGGLPAKSLGSALGTVLTTKHTLAATNAGSLASTKATPPFDPAKLRDVLLAVKYRVVALSDSDG